MTVEERGVPVLGACALAVPMLIARRGASEPTSHPPVEGTPSF